MIFCNYYFYQLFSHLIICVVYNILLSTALLLLHVAPLLFDLLAIKIGVCTYLYLTSTVSLQTIVCNGNLF